MSVCSLRIIAWCHACTIKVVIMPVHASAHLNAIPQIKLWLGTGERHPFYEELIQLRTKFPRKMSEEAALAASKL
jgi:hypothetical protein